MSAKNRQQTFESALEDEFAAERAATLGRVGKMLEAALAALSDHDRNQNAPGVPVGAGMEAARAALVAQAGYALWCVVVQREACGLRDLATVLREFRVPREVYNRMGVFGSRPP